MNRFDRALAILLLLRGGKRRSATDLARRFAVSTRTIYRDVETLGAVGVPVYAEMGRAGGFRLLAGYFLPPVMFTTAEAVSLLLGLTFLHSLRATPFAADLETAEQKLLTAVPDHLHAILADAHKVIGFERPPADIFHPDPPDPTPPTSATAEGTVVSIFLQAVLDRRTLLLQYRSPYRDKTDEITAIPLGLFWDRDRWYLAGRRNGAGTSLRLWRADRVLTITPLTLPAESDSEFDVRAFLGRTWLHEAMEQWRAESPITIRLPQRQAARLQQDWYYRHARYESLPDGDVLMTYGDADRASVLELLRWLGPEAELIAPKAWRAAVRVELAQMLARYDDPSE
ncbi:MAG: helix-turn-helix transcriptional regulator [Thermomicrobiales bacterium]